MGMDKFFQWWVWRDLALLGLGMLAITAPLVAADAHSAAKAHPRQVSFTTDGP